MRRKALMAVLALGAVAGFGSAVFNCRHHGMDRQDAREAFENHVADLCTQAAERSRAHSEKAP